MGNRAGGTWSMGNTHDRAVQDEPLPVRGLVLGAGPVHNRKHPVLPLVRLRVVLAVKLAHRDCFRVHHVVLALDMAFLASFRHQGKRAAQHPVRRRLTGKRLPHDHQPVPHDDHLVQLDGLLEEAFQRLQVRFDRVVA